VDISEATAAKLRKVRIPGFITLLWTGRSWLSSERLPTATMST